jgi:hypothetical protein
VKRATGMMAIERNSLKPSNTDFAADVASSFARQPIMNLMGATRLRGARHRGDRIAFSC